MEKEIQALVKGEVEDKDDRIDNLDDEDDEDQEDEENEISRRVPDLDRRKEVQPIPTTTQKNLLLRLVHFVD